MHAETQPAPAIPAGPLGPSPRWLSVDALRGFDMFWIVGAEDIVHALKRASHSSWADALAGQLDHKPWAGITFYDLIFPLFVFIVGVSLVFSITRTIEKHGRGAAYWRIITRSLLLVLLGIFYYGGISRGIDQIRLMGVLQRIGLAYLFASLLLMNFRWRGLLFWVVGLLVGYWALMSFVPVPGVGAGHFEEGANLANYIDRMYLPFRKWDGDHDPEGLLSTIPAVATCLLGVLAGLLLMNKAISEQRKVIYLFAAGALAVLLGALWGLQFPVIKKIWSSSFVLVAGGFSALFLGVFHQLIEVWKRQRWAMPFVWIGMNALAIYLLHNLVDLPKLAERLAGGPVALALGEYGPVLITIVVLGISFLVARFLYVKKVFLRL